MRAVFNCCSIFALLLLLVPVDGLHILRGVARKLSTVKTIDRGVPRKLSTVVQVMPTDTGGGPVLLVDFIVHNAEERLRREQKVAVADLQASITSLSNKLNSLEKATGMDSTETDFIDEIGSLKKEMDSIKKEMDSMKKGSTE